MGTLRSDILYFSNYSLGTSDPSAALTGTNSIQTTTVKTGIYALRCNPTLTGTGGRFQLPVGTDGVLASGSGSPTYYSKFTFLYKIKPVTNDEPIFITTDISGGILKYELRLDSTGVLKFYDSTLTLVATGATVLAPDVWYDIEIQSSTGAGASAYEVRINQVTELSGTAAQTNNNNSYWGLGKHANRNGNTVDFYYDHYVIATSTWVGDLKPIGLKPTGNASTPTYSWTLGTNSSDFAEVDETPIDSDTTYIRKTASGIQDSCFTFPSLSTVASNADPVAVRVLTYMRKESGTSVTSPLAYYNSTAQVVPATSRNLTTG